MKITKLSLAAIAAMTLTTGAMAEVTNKISGNVKYWYETADTGEGDQADNGLFHKKASGFTSGQAAASVEAKGKAGVLGYGFKYTAVDTLGLEGNMVSSGRTARGDAASASTSDKYIASGKTAHWAEKAFITYNMGKTTAKIGRQHLNTPMAFTEAWNIAANSFDAAVLVNKNIPNVTLVGAFVGRGNGGNGSGPGYSSVQNNGEFNRYVVDGAYAAAVHAKPLKALGLNAYYWNVLKAADAFWVDGDYKVGPVKLGAVYASAKPKGVLEAAGGTSDATSAVAVKAGGKVGPVSLFAAYSQVSEEGSIPIANTATGFKKTKLPTAGVYNDGLIVAAPGAKTFKVKGVYPIGGVKLIAQYVSTTNDNDNGTDSAAVNQLASGAFGKDVDEFDLIAVTKIADVTIKGIFVNRTFKNDKANGSVVHSDANHVRVIAGIKF